MKNHLCDTSITVKMDDSRDLDVASICRSIKCWYQDIARRGKVEGKALYKNKKDKSLRESLSELKYSCTIWFQVRLLEQQNKVLTTKWDLLQQCIVPGTRRNLEPLYESFICNLKKQLEHLLCDRDKLMCEEKAANHLVDEFKCKYEEQINRRTAAENEFVVLKKAY
ncbi:keratin, type II cytoskeletal I-like [Alligator sinensis]|uniref:Keratin, type II cytoskeletal I-like n=1 Tax=Alligator sinensis TaxID=38654 RepID=A0A3Q0HF97_ALLSI|nr:keratin, type II cytoskeletal I-like [Alligator sinensis]